MHLATGTRVLNGRYELGDLIGRGGMADVYRGTDLRLGRSVAVKILRADLARDPQFLARFRREAQSVASLNHVSIVSVYDSGEESQGDGVDSVRAPYIVMEIVVGHSLKELLKDGQVSVDLAIDYTLGVLAALEYSHKAGIVHRDIKPGNAMVVADTGNVKVMDFGIARALTDSSATMTQTQAVVGTAQYLSPEQALGETVDARSDLYSAGCLLYELLTGRPPFQGDSPVSVAYQHVQGIATPPSKVNPDVSSALDSVVIKALRKNREDRFQDAASFRRALRAARGGVSVHDNEPDETAAQPAVVPGDSAKGSPAVALTADPATTVLAGTPAAESTSTTALPVQASDDGSLTLTHDQLRVLLPEIRNLPEVQRAQRKRKHRRGLLVALWIFIIMALGGGGYGLYAWLTRPIPPELVAVPAVAKLSEVDALKKIYDARLQPDTLRVANATVPKGEAISTDPAEGEMVEVNHTIKLIISNGPSSVQIPSSVQGKTEAAVRDLLRQLNLVGAETTTFANSSTVGAGLVITTKPAPGQTVPVGSKVEIVVSTGKVAVPDLVGKNAEEASALLAGLGLKVSLDPQDSDKPVGQVTGQSVAADGLIDQGGTVILTIARKPTPTPTPTPTTPTPTSSDQPSKSADSVN
ncbi:Stk1 family PASTA domain-containing Ser/Thr kinase [Arthrobacter sp. NPDC090010]|uniref:Stk1 family PASTA domain-containing Ser/Thr kinase n=1 Tax=Arthrobacter sp. NPDC090010 TaxID=3363942 RepID=UPI0038190BE1